MDRLSSSIEQIAKSNYGDISKLKLRYQPPRMCKTLDSMVDPSLHDFGLRVWLQTKIGETSEYALAPRPMTDEAQQRGRGTDFQVVGEPVNGDRMKAVYEVFDFFVDKEGMIDILKQGRAILGTFSMYTGDGSIDAHGNAYLLVPEIINHPNYGNRPPTFYILETYKFHSDEVAKAFEYYFDDVFDPYNRLGQKVEVWRINAIELQKVDPLCMSWSIMILYYLAKMPIPQSEMVDNKYVTVEKPLHLNVAVPSLINRAFAKLKSDMGSKFLPADATSTVFPYLYGSGKGDSTMTVKTGEIFKHGSKLSFNKFSKAFETGEYIWTYRYDTGNEHSGTQIYLQAEEPLQLFNLTTNAGVKHFRSVLKELPDPTLLEVFDDKIKNFSDVEASEDVLPKFSSVGSNDKLLAAGLVKYQRTHGMDGWVLKLGSNASEEFLFLEPYTHFRISKHIPYSG